MSSWPSALDQAYIREALLYNPFTGELRWRVRPPHHFKSALAQYCWNARFAGHRAGHVHSKGYRYIKLLGRERFAHHIVWVYVHGALPKVTDHENGDRDANWLRNLRDVTKAINGLNQRRPSHNTSGIAGVSLDRRGGRWRAYIKTGGRNVSLGYYAQKEDAVAARLSAQRELGYHANHGRP